MYFVEKQLLNPRISMEAKNGPFLKSLLRYYGKKFHMKLHFFCLRHVMFSFPGYSCLNLHGLDWLVYFRTGGDCKNNYRLKLNIELVDAKSPIEICLISTSVLPRISTCYYNENVTYDLALLKIESMIEYTSSIKTKFDEQLRK